MKRKDQELEKDNLFLLLLLFIVILTIVLSLLYFYSTPKVIVNELSSKYVIENQTFSYMFSIDNPRVINNTIYYEFDYNHECIKPLDKGEGVLILDKGMNYFYTYFIGMKYNPSCDKEDEIILKLNNSKRIFSKSRKHIQIAKPAW